MTKIKCNCNTCKKEQELKKKEKHHQLVIESYGRGANSHVLNGMG